MKTQVMLIGIGGASCSGKTTLAIKLCSVLPGCSVLHQDASETVPIHPEYGIPDFDNPASTIEWARFRAAVTEIKTKTSFSGGIPSSDSFEPGQDLAPDGSSSVISEWRTLFQEVGRDWLARNIRIEWRIVEGFVLFYNDEVVKNLDVQMFLRSPGHVLQQRRLDRSYPSDVDGEAWVEPPNYWEQIAYPAYIEAHSHLFHKGDVEAGNLSREARTLGLLVLDGQGTEQNLSFEELFKMAASAVLLKSQLLKNEH
ncbi:hypothetical protein BDV93DRAFT_448845 [Ceratobasidium sp. AG-I]|nr:hypothetical protein BDV93DRAFT_448845 [Ceratobasidium sp. AG-I]